MIPNEVKLAKFISEFIHQLKSRDFRVLWRISNPDMVFQTKVHPLLKCEEPAQIAKVWDLECASLFFNITFWYKCYDVFNTPQGLRAETSFAEWNIGLNMDYQKLYLLSFALWH